MARYDSSLLAKRMSTGKLVVLGIADFIGRYYYDFREEWADRHTDQEYLDIRDDTLCLRLGTKI